MFDFTEERRLNDLELLEPIAPILAQANDALKEFVGEAEAMYADGIEEIVVNQEDAARVVAKVKAAADLYDELEALRKQFSVPLDKAKKAIDAMFKPSKAQLDGVKLHMKDQLFSYERLQKELADRAQAEQRKAQEALGLQADAVVTTDKTAGLSTRFKTVLKVTDPNLIPNSYWMLDEAKVLADLQAGVAVPGCELDKEPIVVVRRERRS